MDTAATLKTAIDLMHLPSQARLMRSAPLPDGVVTLVRIVAGDEEAISHATVAVGRSSETVREAAAFFIEQILLYPDADSYRVLAAKPEASNAELRRNMGLLLRWLHPDHAGQGGRAVFARRVIRAWNDLKTKERRAAYDQSRRMAVEKPLQRKNGGAKNWRRSARPLRNSAPYHMRASQFSNIHPKQIGLLRRVLLLIGKVVH